VLQPRATDNSPIGEYDLPDGFVLKMTSYERQNIGEKLFQNFSYPDLDGPKAVSGFAGVHHMILDSI